MHVHGRKKQTQPRANEDKFASLFALSRPQSGDVGVESKMMAANQGTGPDRTTDR